MNSTDIEIKVFSDYQPYRFENGTLVNEPQYSSIGSEPPDFLIDPDTLLIHSMFVQADESHNRSESLDPQDCKNLLELLGVSTHFIIPRNELTPDGRLIVYQMVETNRKAWHAGKSQMPAPDLRTGLNKFSIGVELIGTFTSDFTESQYLALTGLSAYLINEFPIENVLGHNDVARIEVRPDPKTDPWNFDWSLYATMLSAQISEERFNELKIFDGIKR